MLRGILYETIRADAGGATVRLLPESPVYQGHFPGYPITPGVCLVQIALELIGEMAGQVGYEDREMADQAGRDDSVDHNQGVGHDGRKVRLVGAKNIKFTTPVEPGEGAELRFNLKGTGEGLWSVEVLSGGGSCAKMSLTLA